ncbi:LapA family protein [uncultured Pseudacidovorax sp.]|uniref:LapA family protein n=1 Tax=uncultured Pseudacidovorax sp. TaxID=679313 RepID=UPI0025D9EE28|nr:LapA family protein [uncultured Pseudacidovorax sp.]
MGLRSIVLFVIALVIAALAALNWGTLSAPTVMSLGVTTVTAPLGLVMLGLTVLLAAFFLAYVLWLQGTVLVDARRHTKELQAQRELADKAEASRFTELRNFLESQENTHMARNGERHAAVLARIEQLEATLRQRAEQADNTLAAHIGQLEDRLDRRAVTASVATPVAATPLSASTVPASFDPRA